MRKIRFTEHQIIAVLKSGEAEPSQADRQITDRLVKALSLVEVRVLDHCIVGGKTVSSFAERGWL